MRERLHDRARLTSRHLFIRTLLEKRFPLIWAISLYEMPDRKKPKRQVGRKRTQIHESRKAYVRFWPTRLRLICPRHADAPLRRVMTWTTPEAHRAQIAAHA